MLPRLKRFADLLMGAREAGTALLGRALKRMVAEQHRYQRSMALDRFAFAEIYRQWLAEQRDHAGPETVTPDDASFASLFQGAQGQGCDPFTVRFLQNLPPQHRLTLLLVYGEGFDHIDAGRVLDVPAETIATRLLRISAHLADCLGARAKVALSGNVEEPYFDAHYREQAS